MKEENSPEKSGVEASANGFAANCYEWMEALIMALIFVLVFFVFVFRVHTVSGDSMEPNFQNGYKVVVSCFENRPSPGDVVVVDSGGTRLNERIVKRVIATEGQTVNIDFSTGVVSVDGVKLDESAYIENGITKDQYDISFPQKVPAGHVFVLGDNRVVSDDSRSSDVGMIDERYIIGRLRLILYPFSEFKLFG